MIIRRMAEAIRTQNWFTVAIEILIVFIGLSAGFALDRWQTEQSDIAKERIYLARLQTEAEVGLENLADYLEAQRYTLKTSQGLVAKLGDATYCDVLTDTLKTELLVITDFPPPDFSLITAAELIQSGQMPLIRSDQLKTAIGEVTNSIEFIARQWERYSTGKQFIERTVYPATGMIMTAQANRPIDGTVEGDLSQFDFTTIENLCQDKRVIASISNMVTASMAYVAYLERHQSKFQAYANTLEAYAQQTSGHTP